MTAFAVRCHHLPLALIVSAALAASGFAGTLHVPGHHDTIQAALDAASDGDVVQVKPGHYVGGVVVYSSGVTLRGKNVVIDAEYASPCVEVYGADVTLDGLTLVNGAMGVYAATNRTTIQRCTVLSAAEASIELLGDDMLVRGCTIRGSGDEAILYESFTTGSTSRFEGNLMERIDGSAIYAEGGRILVVQNKCFGASSAAEVHPTHPNEASLVSRNRFEVIDDYGFYGSVENAAGLIFERNVFRSTESEGLYLDLEMSGSVVLRDNLLEDTASQGIYIRAESSPNIFIEDNDIARAAGSGIFVRTDMTGLQIRGNDIAYVTDAGIEGSFDGATIYGNRIRSTGREGICVEAAGSGLSRIEKNDVRLAGRDGIRIDGPQHVVEGNKVLDGLGDGIEIFAGAGNIVRSNLCSGNAHEGIDNSGTGTTIEDNVAKKNGRGLGPDIAGACKDGAGTVVSFDGNKFGTGGSAEPQRNDPLN